EMPGPVCCAAGRNFDQVQADEVAAAAQLDEGGAGATAEPRPGCGLDCVEIDRDALDDRNPLARRPFAVGVDQITSTSLTISHGSPRLIARVNFKPAPTLNRAASYSAATCAVSMNCEIHLLRRFTLSR